VSGLWRSTRHVSHARTGFDECTECEYAVLSASSQRDDYWSDSEDVASDSAAWRDINERYFRAALNTLETSTERGRLLDVGGGPGYFEAALQRGRDVYTFDVSPKVSAATAERVGADRVLMRIDEGGWAPFDALSMFCVVAHTRDPAGVLARRPTPSEMEGSS
jgi:SAM-dependent methyltransferase